MIWPGDHLRLPYLKQVICTNEFIRILDRKISSVKCVRINGEVGVNRVRVIEVLSGSAGFPSYGFEQSNNDDLPSKKVSFEVYEGGVNNLEAKNSYCLQTPLRLIFNTL